MANSHPKRRRTKIVIGSNKLPRGAYRLPDGNYIVTGPLGQPDKRGRRICVVGVYRAEPDAKRVADALIALATERIEAERLACDDQSAVDV